MSYRVGQKVLLKVVDTQEARGVRIYGQILDVDPVAERLFVVRLGVVKENPYWIPYPRKGVPIRSD